MNSKRRKKNTLPMTVNVIINIIITIYVLIFWNVKLL